MFALSPLLASDLGDSIWAPKPSPKCLSPKESKEDYKDDLEALTAVPSSASDCSDDSLPHGRKGNSFGHGVSAQVLEAGATTMMVRNLPTKLQVADLIEALDARGYQDAYDFCFVPMDRASSNCKGYAFVNFNSADNAARFAQEQGICFGKVVPRLAQISIAETQGVVPTLQRIVPCKKRRPPHQWTVYVRTENGIEAVPTAEAAARYRPSRR